jgi:hypothetical protein
MWVDSLKKAPSATDTTAAATTTVAAAEQCVEPLRPQHVNQWHDAHVLYLWKAIKQAEEDGIPCVVMTHHLPSLNLVAPQYQGSPLNFAFATPLDGLVGGTLVVTRFPLSPPQDNYRLLEQP